MVSGFRTLEEAVAHHLEGARLRDRLAEELGEGFDVVYWSPEPAKMVAVPREKGVASKATAAESLSLIWFLSAWMPCAVLPWVFAGWNRSVAGLGLLVMWFVVIRPTWRGLAFFLTLLLFVNLAALVLAALLG